MRFFKKIVAYFGESIQRVEAQVQDDDLCFDIDNLKGLNGFDRIVQVYNFLYKQDVTMLSGMIYHDADVVCCMKALESIDMLEEISIDDLLTYHHCDNRGMASTIIGIDYWSRIENLSDRRLLMKILNVGIVGKSHDKIIRQLKNDIDNIQEVERLENCINDYKKETELYTYGAIKLFNLYKQKYGCGSELIQKTKASIDLTIVANLKLDLYQISEKIDGERFFDKIKHIKNLDDIVCLMKEVYAIHDIGICQVKINSTIQFELINDNIDDDRLKKLYHLTTNLDDKKRILVRIKSSHGFVFQESKNLKTYFLESQKPKHDFDRIYYDITSPSLDVLAEESYTLLVDSIITLCDVVADISDFSHRIFCRCNRNYMISEMVCKHSKIAQTMRRLAKESMSTGQLIASLSVVGKTGYDSIIERFYQLSPNVKEILELGNGMVVINDDRIELCYAKNLSDYIVGCDLPIGELRAIGDFFEDSPPVYETVMISTAVKIITYNPQLT